MSDPTYSLVFSGEIADGFDRDQVKQDFARLFKLGAERLEQLFNAPRTVIKRGLTLEDAERYLDKLNVLGARVQLEPSETARPFALELVAKDVEEVPAAQLAPAAPIQIPPRTMPRDEPKRRSVGFEFTGSGGEFFRIWIVNLLLTIVTLGIYSAWAKVRTLRYFYGNTRLDENSFEYLAKPMQILKGRIIAVVLLILYSVIGTLWPLFGMFSGLLVAIATPWLIVRGLSFHLHNSAWRGVRFGFDGKVGSAAWAFIGWPLLALLTLGLLFPLSLQRQQRFLIEHSRYGATQFGFTAGPGVFYAVAGIGLLVTFGGFGLAYFVGKMIGHFVVPMMLAYLATFVYFRVALINVAYSSSTLGPHRLNARYAYGSYAALVVTNGLALLCTLGLFYPWARVRTACYAAEHVAMNVSGDLDGFVADQRNSATATGGEVAEFFSVDLGL
ncbi:YjgN family protein [Pseudomonas matsuisoli]|uniref:DUF898 domain-containing protein n=1 Tax=Pseudomonas matsuisoli TaxID=1515666 RepID=A0A917UZJ5_9PSED|nr:YjgN family protein [Pseudomonas matsuisoli]GGK00888.1 hypothetical protein GCM10009304_28420 [Pseudomonas matsuisoli]